VNDGTVKMTGSKVGDTKGITVGVAEGGAEDVGGTGTEIKGLLVWAAGKLIKNDNETTIGARVTSKLGDADGTTVGSSDGSIVGWEDFSNVMDVGAAEGKIRTGVEEGAIVTTATGPFEGRTVEGSYVGTREGICVHFTVGSPTEDTVI
jgi:hypothetical protein